MARQPDNKGEQLYTAWRACANRIGQKRGNDPEPSWKDLKPWRKRIWNDFARLVLKDEESEQEAPPESVVVTSVRRPSPFFDALVREAMERYATENPWERLRRYVEAYGPSCPDFRCEHEKCRVIRRLRQECTPGTSAWLGAEGQFAPDGSIVRWFAHDSDGSWPQEQEPEPSTEAEPQEDRSPTAAELRSVLLFLNRCREAVAMASDELRWMDATNAILQQLSVAEGRSIKDIADELRDEPVDEGEPVYRCSDCGAYRTRDQLSPDNVCLKGLACDPDKPMFEPPILDERMRRGRP